MLAYGLDYNPHAPDGVDAANLGEFEHAERFTDASPDLLTEIYCLHGAVVKDTPFHSPGNTGPLLVQIEKYRRHDSPAGQVMAGFLGKIAADVEQLLPLYDYQLQLSQVIADFHSPAVMWGTLGAGQRHVDGTKRSAPLGLRYITVNRNPTLIDGISDFAAGDVARLVLGRTYHTHGMRDGTPENPRARLLADL